MGLFYVILSIICESAGKTSEKLGLNKTKIKPQKMMLLLFITMSTLIGLYYAVFIREVPDLSLSTYALLISVVLVSFGANYYEALSLKINDLAFREPVNDFRPIAAGAIGLAIFEQEKTFIFLFAFIIGGIITYWGTHEKRLSLRESKGMHLLIYATTFDVFAPTLYKLSLDYVSPEFLSLWRVTLIAVLTAIFIPSSRFRSITKRKLQFGILSGAIYALGAIAALYALDILGVATAMLLLLLGPSLRYLSAHFILHEHVTRREITSSALLVILVVGTTYI